MILRVLSAAFAASTLAGCAVAQEPPAETEGAMPGPPAWITLLGNYAGKQLRITVDDRVIVDQRLNFPPMGAEHRFEAATGPTRIARVSVILEGCPAPWMGEVELAPMKSTPLIFDGCAVRAYGPE